MLHKDGRIEVICGSMFCGKTEELIRRVRRAVIAQQQVQVFKPRIDDRYSIDNITSHNGQKIEAELIDTAQDITTLLQENTTVVAIDEVQFLDNDIIDIIESLATDGVRVIVAGLDMDFRGEPFGAMPQLLALAEDVTKLQAICMVCMEPASHTQRLVNGRPAYYDDPIILVGAKESYEARCRKHHNVPRRDAIKESDTFSQNGHH